MRARPHVVCAPNAFKGTLTAAEAAQAMKRGASAAGAAALGVPIADGGDGTLDVLLGAAGGAARVTRHTVTGPLGQPVTARLGWVDDVTAVVELAEASGLRLLDAGHLEVLQATSRGTGELVGAALDGGAGRVIVGVGGSAGVDGGAGMLQALGARLLDADGDELALGGGALPSLARLDLAGVDPRVRRVAIDVAVDVRNPLLGTDGAAPVFGPQKGAGPAEVALLEHGLGVLAHTAARDCGAAGLAAGPGAGAAGGAGYALALLGARLVPGAALVCDTIGLDARIDGAGLVFTGEGRLDAQTASGKAPAEVATRARARGIACVAIAGQVIDPLPHLFTAAYSLENIAGGADARTEAAAHVERAALLATTEFISATRS